MPFQPVKFPENFLWGAATAGHQVEGGSRNDWSEWERSESRIDYLRTTGLEAKFGIDNFISGQACAHYDRFKEDFSLAKQLGHNATRLSVEWSRIEPEKGKIDRAALGHYVEVIEHLREIGIRPFVTLWHWPIPLWIRDRGGWRSRDTPRHFARYCETVVRALNFGVRHWITLNEPEVYTASSFMAGVWPPQQRNPISYLTVLHNLIAGHRRAYSAIKAIDNDALVGIAKANICFEAQGNGWVNRLFKAGIDWWWNSYFLQRIKQSQDFIGLNFYMKRRVNYGIVDYPQAEKSDVGWDLFPEAIYDVLMQLKRYNKPVYITENGVADERDKFRAWFIVESLRSIARAIDAGVDIRGYLHWSLMDNFEWEKGFWPRFGLIEIDYETLRRNPRPSARVYADICAANGITGRIVANYADLVGRI